MQLVLGAKSSHTKVQQDRNKAARKGKICFEELASSLFHSTFRHRKLPANYNINRVDASTIPAPRVPFSLIFL